eukprot:4363764-Ditylum_brightwellii.AAC.1
MADGIEVGSEVGMAESVELGSDITPLDGEFEGIIDGKAVGCSKSISTAPHILSLVPLHSHKWIP